MREPKFRMWDMGRMVGPFGFYEVYANEVNPDNGVTEPVIMRDIGVIDKHGKPVFEGDIVKLTVAVYADCSKREIVETKTYKGEICWHTHGWTLKDEKAYRPLFWLDDDRCEWEVLGNIYENPELAVRA